jgi:hypothetical protein
MQGQGDQGGQEDRTDRLLRVIAARYRLDYDELQKLSQSLDQGIVALEERPGCSWVYQRASGAKKKGDICDAWTLDGYVFCPKHHRQAGANTNAVIIGAGILQEVEYDPRIGIIEKKMERGQRTVTIRGRVDQGALPSI